jgi:hypothetical protein
MMWMKLKKVALEDASRSLCKQESIRCGEVYTAANLCNEFFGRSPYVDERSFERLDRLVVLGLSELVLTLI